MSGASNGDAAEVNGEDIESGFGASVDGSCEATDEAIGIVQALNDFDEEAIGGAAAEGAHEDHGEEIGGEAEGGEDGGKRRGEEADDAGFLEHADGDEHGDEVGDGALGGMPSFFGAFDKLLINFDPSEGGVERKEREEKGDGEEGEGHEGADREAFASEVWGEGWRVKLLEPFWKNEEEKHEEESGEVGEDEGDFERGEWGKREEFEIEGIGGSGLGRGGGWGGVEDFGGFEEGETFEDFGGEDAGDGGASGGEEGGDDDGGGAFGALGGEDPDGGEGEELDGGGIEGEERAHGVGGGSGEGVKGIEETHGAEAERGGGVSEAEHIGGHIHDHGAHGGVMGGDIWKEEAEEGAEEGGELLDEAGAFGEAHHSEPDGPDAEEGEGDFEDGFFGAFESTGGEIGKFSGEAGDENGDEEHGQPDEIEHGGDLGMKEGKIGRVNWRFLELEGMWR